MKKIYVLGGGTVFHLRPHMALCAPAYGKTAVKLALTLEDMLGKSGNFDTQIHLGLTKMAMGASQDRHGHNNTHLIGETNVEVAQFIEKIVADPDTKMIFMSVALCDFEGSVGTIDSYPREIQGRQWAEYEVAFNRTASGKNEPRLKSDERGLYVELKQADKLIGSIRKKRKDIFLVGFKTTTKATEDEQYEAALSLLKKNSCNLVLANDVHTGLNQIVCPELASYSVTTDRVKVLTDLVEMALARSSNKFTRTEISAEGVLLPFDHEGVPDTFRKVLKWCVENGAYKPFNNVTVGHFGVRSERGNFWSSRRKQNYNNPGNMDLVHVSFTDGKQVAHGAKPSAGARSQYIVLSKYDDLDCIVHFHCPAKPHSMVPVRSQKEFECGSHQCGKNTADGMVRVNKDLAAVMLDKHGPNIVFSSKADPAMVIDFIRSNFDLTRQTR